MPTPDALVERMLNVAKVCRLDPQVSLHLSRHGQHENACVVGEFFIAAGLQKCAHPNS